MRSFRRSRKQRKAIERAKDARLAKAEGDLQSLKARATTAIITLDARRQRNHWRESVERMIQGGF